MLARNSGVAICNRTAAVPLAGGGALAPDFKVADADTHTHIHTNTYEMHTETSSVPDADDEDGDVGARCVMLYHSIRA